MPAKRCALVFVTVVLVSGIGMAQIDRGTILGTVTDASGGVIPQARVTVQNMGTSAVIELTTDDRGLFITPPLPVGTYRVSATAEGFRTYHHEGVSLSVNSRVDVPIVLSPGQVEEEITVTAGEVLIETTTATTGGVVNEELAKTLPLNGRAVTDLMRVVPGMVAIGPPSINGGSDGRLFQPGLKYLVDGGDSSQVDSDFAAAGYLSNARITRVGVDAISEFRMVTGISPAEYGQSTGAVINFVTKSGTNQLHGGLFHFFRNEVFDSRNYFNREPDEKPAFRLNQFGGSLGGPIVRDRLFFFGNYEGIRQRLGVAQTAVVFTQAFRDTLAPELQPVVAQMPLPNGPVSPTEPRLALFSRGVSNALREDTWTWKIDYQPSQNDHISFRHTGADTFTRTFFGVSEGQFRNIPLVKHLGRLSYTRTISPTLVNEASFAVNRLRADPAGAGTEAVRTFPQVTFALGGGTAFGGGSLATVGPSTFDLLVGNTAYQFHDTLSWVRGRHQIKFGTQIVRNQANKAVDFQRFVQFLSLDNFAANDPFLILTIGWPRMGMRGTYYAFFVHDDVKVSNRLTINAGLRYQYDTAPTESQGRIANFNPQTGDLDPAGTPILNAPKANFAPRLGFAYTPFDNQGTVLRGGYGIFFANLNPALAQFLPANLPEINQQRLVLFPGVGFPTPDISNAPGSTALNSMERDWNGTYTQQWNLGIQQEISRTMMIDVGYVGNRALHLLPSNNGMELNPVNPDTGVRRYPAWATITHNLPGLNANYHALQLAFRRRAMRLNVGAHYTWAHAFDENTQTFAPAAQDPNNLRAEYASADYDVRHNFVVYYNYDFPRLGALPSWLGEGWSVNGITAMRSGFPVNVVCGCDSRGIGAATGRPNLVPGVPLRPANAGIPGNQINVDAFATPAAGTFGNAPRNLLRGPAVYNTDFSLLKLFRIAERQTVQFRAEVFNLFNTPQFNNPSANLASPATFGQSFSTITTGAGFGSNRQIQFALKYDF